MSTTPIRVNKHAREQTVYTRISLHKSLSSTVCLQLSSLSGQLLSIIKPTQAILDPNHPNWSNEMEGQVDRAKTNTAKKADDEEEAALESFSVVV